MTDCSWLEKFDALQLYRLGAKAWQFQQEQAGMEKDVHLWEEGNLELIPLGDGWHQLYGRLLEIVMPKIASLVVGPSGNRYLKRPVKDWKVMLQGWRTHISNPVSWGFFVEYTNRIEDLLWYDYPGYKFFNLRYRDRLEFLSDDQLELLLNGLNEFTESHEKGRSPVLKHAEAQVLGPVIAKIGDLAIGSMYGRWRLSEFTIVEGN
jgi:hypothetical protein